jgi:hypothetical protein
VPIKCDTIQLDDYYLNKKCVRFPVAYLAYVDKNGFIRNLKGDTYTKLKSNNEVESFKEIKIDNTIPYYDIVKVNLILDCKDRIFDPRKAVFLVDNNLYDIWGRLIEPALEQEVEVPQIEEPVETPTEPAETKPVEQEVCNVIDIDFSTLTDKLGFISLIVKGNKNIEGDSFIFDGNTYIQTNKPNFEPYDMWELIISFKEPQISENYMSLLCLTKDGENVFNILTEKYDVFVYANNDLHFIDDLGEAITTQFNKIKVTSAGEVYVNGNLKANVGDIDLSQCNWNFIIGGDFNTDGSVNNFYVGEINKFCVKGNQ